MTLQELIDRAVSIATAGLTPEQLSTVEGEIVGEDLLTTVFAGVSGECAADRAKRGWLRRTVVVAFTNGSGTLDQTVLTDYLCESVLIDTADPTARYSYQPDRDIFQFDGETRLGRYHIDESVILVVQPGNLFVAGAGLSGNLSLITPADVAVPAAAASAIVARDEVVELILSRLVNAIRGSFTRSTK